MKYLRKMPLFIWLIKIRLQIRTVTQAHSLQIILNSKHRGLLNHKFRIISANNPLDLLDNACQLKSQLLSFILVYQHRWIKGAPASGLSERGAITNRLASSTTHTLQANQVFFSNGVRTLAPWIVLILFYRLLAALPFVFYTFQSVSFQTYFLRVRRRAA